MKRTLVLVMTNKIYKTAFIVLIIEMFFVLNLNAQTYISPGDFYPTNSNFAESPLQNGIPEIEPGKSFPLKLKNASFAWINPAAGFQSIYFVKGTGSNNKDDYLVLTVSMEQDAETTPLEIVKQTNSNIYGFVILSETINNSYSFPLRINYSKKDNSIKYFWPQNIGSNNTGNIGTIVPIIKTGDKTGNDFLSSLSSKIDATNLKNKIVVINWGDPASDICRKSESVFDSLYKNYRNNKNVIFIIAGGKANNSIGNYLHIKGSPSVSSALGEVFPLNLIIDSSGKVVFSQIGYGKQITNQFNSVLKKYIPGK